MKNIKNIVLYTLIPLLLLTFGEATAQNEKISGFIGCYKADGTPIPGCQVITGFNGKQIYAVVNKRTCQGVDDKDEIIEWGHPETGAPVYLEFIEDGCLRYRDEETVTTLVDNGDGSFTYTNEEGVTMTYSDADTQNTVSSTTGNVEVTETTNPDGTTNYDLDVCKVTEFKLNPTGDSLVINVLNPDGSITGLTTVVPSSNITIDSTCVDGFRNYQINESNICTNKRCEPITVNVELDTFYIDKCDTPIGFELDSLITFCSYGQTDICVINEENATVIIDNSGSAIVYVDPLACSAKDTVFFDLVAKCEDGTTDTAEIVIIIETKTPSSIAVVNDPSHDNSELTDGNFEICITNISTTSTNPLVITDNNGNVLADVELLTGQDITTGFQNDAGGNWATNFAPYITSTTLLSTGNTCFDFSKRNWAIANNLTYQDGTLTSTQGSIGTVYESEAVELEWAISCIDDSNGQELQGNSDIICRLVDDIIAIAGIDCSTTEIEMFLSTDYVRPISNEAIHLGTTYTLSNSSLVNDNPKHGQVLNIGRPSNYYNSNVGYDPASTTVNTVWDNGMVSQSNSSVGASANNADVSWWIFDRNNTTNPSVNNYVSISPTCEQDYGGTLDIPLDLYYSDGNDSNGYGGFGNVTYSVDGGAATLFTPNQWGVFATSRYNFLNVLTENVAIGQRIEVEVVGTGIRNDGSGIEDPFSYIMQVEVNYAY